MSTEAAIVAAALIGALAALIGGTFGAVVSYKIATRQFRATVLSANRQEWINRYLTALNQYNPFNVSEKEAEIVAATLRKPQGAHPLEQPADSPPLGHRQIDGKVRAPLGFREPSPIRDPVRRKSLLMKEGPECEQLHVCELIRLSHAEGLSPEGQHPPLVFLRGRLKAPMRGPRDLP